MSYDTKCYELAAYFLDDITGSTDAERAELAQEIQTVIEDFCSGLEEDVEMKAEEKADG